MTDYSQNCSLIYKLELCDIPDELFSPETPVRKWIDLAKKFDGRLPAGSLRNVVPIEVDVNAERICGIALWMAMNVVPLLILCFLFLKLAIVGLF